jgi:putative addiction module component (TIGR02574 family)
MEMTLEQISLEILQLPTKSRALLARKLLDSLDPTGDVSSEHEILWATEAERRFQDIVEGKAETIPADEVMRAARERFKR